jgi:hypothetical protein
MAITQIKRSTGKLPAARRSTVTANQLFQYVNSQTGKADGTIYAHFGYGDSLGKFFSVALTGVKEGTLCGSPNNREVSIVGSYEYQVAFLPKSKITVNRRDALQAGDVFQVPNSAEAKLTGKPSLYIHLGRVDSDRRVLAFNLNTKKLAVGSKMNGAVQKVGDINIATHIV